MAEKITEEQGCTQIIQIEWSQNIPPLTRVHLCSSVVLSFFSVPPVFLGGSLLFLIVWN